MKNCPECSVEFLGKNKYCGRSCQSAVANRLRAEIQAKKSEQSFWNRIRHDGQCWIWTYQIDTDGYGRVRYRGVGWLAHRLAYKFHYGIDPGDLVVCHKCDRPPCINPAHLFVGTNKMNSEDCAIKNRTAFGSHNGRAKLTEGIVREIRKERIVPISDLARRYNVNYSTIRDIISRKIWKRLD